MGWGNASGTLTRVLKPVAPDEGVVRCLLRRPSTGEADRRPMAERVLPQKKAARELNASWRGFHGFVRDVVVMSSVAVSLVKVS